jgi:hypothetical protein
MTCINAVFGGNSVSRVETFSNLPQVAQDGDLYETLDTHTLWVYNANTSAWISAGGTVNITVSTVAPSAPGNEGDLWVVI